MIKTILFTVGITAAISASLHFLFPNIVYENYQNLSNSSDSLQAIFEKQNDSLKSVVEYQDSIIFNYANTVTPNKIIYVQKKAPALDSVTYSVASRVYSILSEPDSTQ